MRHCDVAVGTLFQPVRIGTVTVTNRIAMAPMTREFSPAGIPTPEVAAYYARRGAEGVGLIITEGMAVNAAGAHDGPIPLLFRPEALPGIADIATAVHRHGAKVMP